MMKVIIGLVSMALSTSVIYTFFSYGSELWWPYFAVALAVASLYCLFVVGSLVVALVWMKRMSFGVFVVALAVITFGIFLLWNIASLSSAIKYVVDGDVLVEAGSITASGYAKSIFDSAITALIAVFGGVVLWMVGFRDRGKFGHRAGPGSRED